MSGKRIVVSMDWHYVVLARLLCHHDARTRLGSKLGLSRIRPGDGGRTRSLDTHAHTMQTDTESIWRFAAMAMHILLSTAMVARPSTIEFSARNVHAYEGSHGSHHRTEQVIPSVASGGMFCSNGMLF